MGRSCHPAWPMGDESLIASLHSLDAAAPNIAGPRTIAAIGKQIGFGEKTSAFIGQEARANDTTIKLLPFQAHTACV